MCMEFVSLDRKQQRSFVFFVKCVLKRVVCDRHIVYVYI